jgi:pimeloyl-ACP methyl ester carboxylesterase
MSVKWYVENPAGTRTMVFIGGGAMSEMGVIVKPLKEQQDYDRFIQHATSRGWKIIVVYGQDFLSAYYDQISNVAKGTRDTLKPILVAHSAGAFVTLDYVKGRNQESWFERVVLFNCPLVCPGPFISSLQYCYTGTDRIKANTELIMSERDHIMEWSLHGVSQKDAVEIVRKAGKVRVRVLNQPDYEHNPFGSSNVAWNIIGQIPTAKIALTATLRLRVHGLKSSIIARILAIAKKLRSLFDQLTVS